MLVQYLKSKLHRAQVTSADPEYEGSLLIDADLMDAAGIQPYERILVGNCANGHRFETYAIEGPRRSGAVSLNGATALLGAPGDKIIIMSFCLLTPEEAREHRPRVVILGADNRPAAAAATA
jgi:aspartate 1-decarboxylase